MLIIDGQTVNWTGPGLPTHSFRVTFGGGRAEYRPSPLMAAQQPIRSRMLQLLGGGGPLASGVASLIQRTSRGHEFSAYIMEGGTLEGIAEGSNRHAPIGTPPSGNVVGYIHTHPITSAIIAPPSANDFQVSFQRYPVQLVAEMGGRIWGTFHGGYCSLLGNMQRGSFTAATDPSARLVYRVYSGDALRLETHEREREERAAAARRQSDARRELAERRRREAEARRSRLSR